MILRLKEKRKVKKLFRSIYLALFLSLVLMPESWAISITTKDVVEYSKTMMQPLVSLAIVIFLIYAVFLTYSKLNRFNMEKFSRQSARDLQRSRVTLLSHLSLGQNKSIEVVKIDETCLVLGVTAETISLIKEFALNDNNEVPSSVSDLADILGDSKSLESSMLNKLNNVKAPKQTNSKKDEIKLTDLYEKYLGEKNVSKKY